MNFKSKNWNYIHSQGMKVKVEYTSSLLYFNRSDKEFEDVPTIVVTIWNAECRYVGVAQCGPRDSFNREKGREIAAGRALKVLDAHVENEDFSPNLVLALEGEVIQVYGHLPATVMNQVSDRCLFEGV